MLIHHKKIWLCTLLGAITLKFEAGQPKKEADIPRFLTICSPDDQIQKEADIKRFLAICSPDDQIQKEEVAKAIKQAYGFSHGKYAAELVRSSMASVEAVCPGGASFSYQVNRLLPRQGHHYVASLKITYNQKFKNHSREFYDALKTALVKPNKGCQLVQSSDDKTGTGIVKLIIMRNLYLNKDSLTPKRLLASLNKAPSYQRAQVLQRIEEALLEEIDGYPFQVLSPAASVTSQFIHHDGSTVSVQDCHLPLYGAFLAKNCEMTQIGMEF